MKKPSATTYILTRTLSKIREIVISHFLCPAPPHITQPLLKILPLPSYTIPCMKISTENLRGSAAWKEKYWHQTIIAADEVLTCCCTEMSYASMVVYVFYSVESVSLRLIASCACADMHKEFGRLGAEVKLVLVACFVISLEVIYLVQGSLCEQKSPSNRMCI